MWSSRLLVRGVVLLLGCGLASSCAGPHAAPGTQTSLLPALPEGALPNPAALTNSFAWPNTGEGIPPTELSIDAVLGLARLDEIGGHKVEAETGFKRAVRLDNNSSRTLDALGRFYVDQQRWTDATATLYKASLAAPDDPRIRFDYGMALARSGQFTEALTQLCLTVPEAEAHFHLGRVLFDQGDLSGSEDQFVQALLHDPSLASARHWLADVRRERELELGAGPTVPVAYSGTP